MSALHLTELIREIIHENEISYRTLAKETGYDHTKIYRFVTGQTKKPDYNMVIAIYIYLSRNGLAKPIENVIQLERTKHPENFKKEGEDYDTNYGCF